MLFKRFAGWAAAMTVAAVVAACGGGGGDAGDCLYCGETGGTPKAADLTLALNSATIKNSGTETVTATVTAVDSNRNTVSGIPVTLSVNSDATVAVSATNTSSSGTVTGDIGIGNNKINRGITVTATSGTISKQLTLFVTGTTLDVTVAPAIVDPSAAGSIKYTVKDASGNPMDGVPISLTGINGEAVTGASTDSTGVYTYNYTAPTAGGAYEVRATVEGLKVNAQTITVRTATTTVPPASIPVRAPSLLASPSVVSVNDVDSTVQYTEVRALFVGDANQPIKNIRVRFDLAGDPNNIGGSFDVGNSLIYSTANGTATAQYRPGQIGSPTDGVTVRACWDYTDFAAGVCPNAVTTKLTVIALPLSVSLGTDATVGTGETGLTYVRRYVVQVVDSSGLAKKDVQVSANLDLLQYRKGEYFVAGEAWAQTVRATCDNEDINRNGINETYSNGGVEDANQSFNLSNGREALEPRKADAAVSFEGGVTKTDANGQVVLKIEYPMNVASWVRFNLVVSASGIGGSEGRTNFSTWLDVLADEVNDTETDVPFRVSPYGIEASPTVVVTSPASGSAPARTATLCTNPR